MLEQEARWSEDGRKLYRPGTCLHNEGVNCSNWNRCGICGWNPSVAKSRNGEFNKAQLKDIPAMTALELIYWLKRYMANANNYFYLPPELVLQSVSDWLWQNAKNKTAPERAQK